MLFLKKTGMAVLAVLGFTTVLAQPQKEVADKIIAVVGDHIILQSEIQNSIKDILRSGGEVSDSTNCLLTEQALILKILMLQAQKDSLIVTDVEVEAELDERIRYFMKSLGTKKAVEEACGKTIYKLKDDVRQIIKERRLAEAMQQKIVENIKITPGEVRIFFDRIAKDSLPFYASELEIGRIVARPRVSEDMKKYIASELHRYRKQVEYKVMSFEQLAAKVSEDMESKERGGLYELDRNDKTWEPALLAAIFRLEKDEISIPIETKLGFHLVQMLKKNGDNAVIRQILLVPPLAETDIDQAASKLGALRSKITSGGMSFNDAANENSEKEYANSPVYLLGRDGSPYIPIDQLDKEMVATISKMKVGEISQPVVFTGEQGKKEVCLIYLKSRSEPHRMNLKDDYSRVSQMALEEKRELTLNKWILARIPAYYIMVDNATSANCPQVQKFANTDK